MQCAAYFYHNASYQSHATKLYLQPWKIGTKAILSKAAFKTTMQRLMLALSRSKRSVVPQSCSWPVLGHRHGSGRTV